MHDQIASLMEDAIAEKASTSINVQDEQLRQVSVIASKIKAGAEDVASLEERLKEAKKEQTKLTDEELPQLLMELGMSSFKLKDGTAVEIKKTYGASIPVELFNGYVTMVTGTLLRMLSLVILVWGKIAKLMNFLELLEVRVLYLIRRLRFIPQHYERL